MWTGFTLSVANAYIFARMLGALGQAGAKAAIDFAFGQLTGAAVASVQSQTVDGGLVYYIGESGGDVLVLIGPLTNLVNAAKFVTGYTVAPQLNAALAYNSFARSQAQAIAAQWVALGYSFTKRITISGFSAGGCAALELGLLCIAQQTPQRPKIVTFGSPRNVGTFGQQAIGETTCRRWMNDSDPVPTLPFNPLGDPLSLLGAPFAVLNQVTWFVHVAHGNQLDSLGNVTGQVLPTAAVGGFSLDVASWLLSQATLAASPHNIAEYVRRLGLANQEAITPAQQNPPGGGDEHFNPANRRELVRAQQSAVRTIFQSSAAATGGPVDLPELSEFTTARIGPVWVVSFNAVIVAIGPTKRRAKAYARAANAMLRHQQVLGTLDPTALAAQTADFIERASTPGNGFTPTLQTQFPS